MSVRLRYGAASGCMNCDSWASTTHPTTSHPHPICGPRQFGKSCAYEASAVTAHHISHVITDIGRHHEALPLTGLGVPQRCSDTRMPRQSIFCSLHDRCVLQVWVRLTSPGQKCFLETAGAENGDQQAHRRGRLCCNTHLKYQSYRLSSASMMIADSPQGHPEK